MFRLADALPHLWIPAFAGKAEVIGTRFLRMTSDLNSCSSVGEASMFSVQDGVKARTASKAVLTWTYHCYNESTRRSRP